MREADEEEIVVGHTPSQLLALEVQRKMLCDVVDDHFLAKYRALLDAEDEAFDELEHAYEDGDRDHFDRDLAAWRAAIERKLSYLHHLGLVSPPALAV